MSSPDKPPSLKPSLTRKTFNLTPRAAADLKASCELDQASETDTINRAISMYAVVQRLLEHGALTVLRPDGTTERIWFL